MEENDGAIFDKSNQIRSFSLNLKFTKYAKRIYIYIDKHSLQGGVAKRAPKWHLGRQLHENRVTQSCISLPMPIHVISWCTLFWALRRFVLVFFPGFASNRPLDVFLSFSTAKLARSRRTHWWEKHSTGGKYGTQRPVRQQKVKKKRKQKSITKQ